MKTNTKLFIHLVILILSVGLLLLITAPNSKSRRFKTHLKVEQPTPHKRVKPHPTAKDPQELASIANSHYVLYEKSIKDKAFRNIQIHEGFRRTSYKCSSGVKTIGYGSTYLKRSSITESEAKLLAYKRIDELYLALRKNLSAYQNPNQIASLISLGYNIGEFALINSTLLKKINSNAPNKEIKQEFLRWINIKKRLTTGKVVKTPLKGLKTRRIKEFQSWASV